VRQLWESTNAAGEWAVTFDGKYTRLLAPSRTADAEDD